MIRLNFYHCTEILFIACMLVSPAHKEECLLLNGFGPPFYPVLIYKVWHQILDQNLHILYYVV